MVYDYLITLKKPDYKLVDRVSQIMYLFALLTFAYFYYHDPKSGVVYLFIDACILLFWIFIITRKQKKGAAFFRTGLFIGGLGWAVGPERNVWLAILYIVAGLLEKQAKFRDEIGFSETEISFNRFPARVLRWNEVNNVVIKDGLITIDEKNNKLTQKEIEGFTSTAIEQEFNAFAGRCLATSKNAR